MVGQENLNLLAPVRLRQEAPNQSLVKLILSIFFIFGRVAQCRAANSGRSMVQLHSLS